MADNRLVPFELHNTNGKLTDADQIGVSETGIMANKLNGALNELSGDIATLQNTAFNSGRSFIRFNDGFTIDETNLATFEDKNIIYTAKNDKPLDGSTRPDVNLPTDAQIAAAGESYPIVFEFTHLGGTAVFQDTNLLRLFVDGVELTRLVRDQASVVVKTGVGVDYTFTSAGFDPNDTILPTGVFNLKTDTHVTDISTIATELSGVTIVAGDAYLIETGGAWAGFTVPDNSILVAIVSSASLVDSADNNDWLLLDNPRVNAKSAAFLANWVQDGIKFNSNRNIQIHPDNVVVFESMASGLPIEREIGGNTQGSRNIRYDNVPMQLSDIVGGRLTLSLNFAVTRVSGFSPIFERMEIRFPDFNGVVFDFPLTDAPQNGMFSSTIEIPSVDYSAAINSNASVILYYTFTGASFFGSYTLLGLVNTSKGRLHDAVLQLANTSVAEAEMRLGTRIDEVVGTVEQEDSSIASLLPRISPYRNDVISDVDITARWLNSTGADNFPSSISLMNETNPVNPRFTAGDIAFYIAVVAGGSHVLKNITQDSVLSLDDSEATVSLGESLTYNEQVYFVYQVASITATDVYEVEKTSLVQVVAWQNDINQLDSSIERIDSELSHAALNLMDGLVHVLETEVTVTEEDSPSIVATDYNIGLGNTVAQTVFYENSPNTPVGGNLNSKPINEHITDDRYRRKLLYIPEGQTYSNGTIVSAWDKSITRDLVTYANGLFLAKVFVPLVPAGSTVVSLYPAPSNQVAGAGIWQTIPTLIIQNGIPVTEADELFFTRNVPQSSVTLNIAYRGHANGNLFGSGSITLANVGGANEIAQTFVLNDGSEAATVEVRYYPNFQGTGRAIRVSVNERVNTGLPTINDIQVILSYTETRVIPATPATTRDVGLEALTTAGQVFAIRPSATGTLIVVGGTREVDTGYPYTVLFDTDESGYLTVANEAATFFDYEDLDPINTTIIDLENHAILPQFGLFRTEYTHETIVNLGTGLRVSGLFGVAKLTTTQRDALTAENGDIIYNTTDKKFNYFEDDAWRTRPSNP